MGEDESPEIMFDLQVAGDESVPDAVISQKIMGGILGYEGDSSLRLRET